MKHTDTNTPIYAFIGRELHDHLQPRWWIGASVRQDMAPKTWQPVPCK